MTFSIYIVCIGMNLSKFCRQQMNKNNLGKFQFLLCMFSLILQALCKNGFLHYKELWGEFICHSLAEMACCSNHS